MDAPQNPHWLAYLTGALGLLNLLQTLGLVLRRESADERKAVLARLDAVERKADNHELRIAGNEHLSSQILAELAKLPALHVTVATVANDVRHLNDGITEIKNSLNQLKKP
jgi:hypothetical protein